MRSHKAKPSLPPARLTTGLRLDKQVSRRPAGQRLFKKLTLLHSLGERCISGLFAVPVRQPGVMAGDQVADNVACNGPSCKTA